MNFTKSIDILFSVLLLVGAALMLFFVISAASDFPAMFPQWLYAIAAILACTVCGAMCIYAVVQPLDLDSYTRAKRDDVPPVCPHTTWSDVPPVTMQQRIADAPTLEDAGTIGELIEELRVTDVELLQEKTAHQNTIEYYKGWIQCLEAECKETLQEQNDLTAQLEEFREDAKQDADMIEDLQSRLNLRRDDNHASKVIEDLRRQLDAARFGRAAAQEELQTSEDHNKQFPTYSIDAEIASLEDELPTLDPSDSDYQYTLTYLNHLRDCRDNDVEC